MCFKPKWLVGENIPDVYINGTKLKYVSEYKYLGNTYSDKLTDDVDISCKIRNLYCRGNCLVKNFKSCSDEVKCTLFRAFCTNIYGCSLWISYKQKSLKHIRVAYNNTFRSLFGFKRDTSISLKMAQLGINHFNVIHRLCINSINSRLCKSDNMMVSSMFKSCWFTSTSRMYKHWSSIIY